MSVITIKGAMTADIAPRSAAEEGSEITQENAAYRKYALVVLTGVTFFYSLDRSVMYITQELVKTEFRLSDSALGLVSGVAYGLANGLAGIPMGWLIDKVNRAKLLPICVMIWSAMTTLCGLSGSFVQLCLARIGVGLAESGGTPTTLSIISDLYPVEQRASRIGIIWAGYGAGTIASSFTGGYIAAHYGWRTAFLVFGIPGMLLGIVLFFTLREPDRTQRNAAPTSVGEIARTIMQLVLHPILRMIFIATALTSMVSAGVFIWWASFMMRTHNLDLPTVGVISTVCLGICGVLGLVGTGLIADRTRRATPGGPLLVASVTTALNLVFTIVALWASSTAVMVAALCVAGSFAAAYSGPGNATISEIAPPHLRGLAFTLPAVLTNLFGATLGPLLVGVLSDLFGSVAHGTQPLRLAMFSVMLLQIPVCVIYLRAGRKLQEAAG